MGVKDSHEKRKENSPLILLRVVLKTGLELQ
jgi:hypothetical protein